MGANLPAKKYSKGTPSQITLDFEFPANSHSTDPKYISLSHALTAINRKHFRQGLYYYVTGMEVLNDENAIVDVYTIPDTWYTRQAWRRGFKHYQKMNKYVLENSNVKPGAYNDYVVFMDQRQAFLHGNTSNSSDGLITGTPWMRPQVYQDSTNNGSLSFAGATLASEFVSDEFAIGDASSPVQFWSHMVGDTLSSGPSGGIGGIVSIGLIHSYGLTRETVDQFSNPTLENNLELDWLEQLTNSRNDEMSDQIENLHRTDNAPYDVINYPGGSSTEGLIHQTRICTDNTDIGRVGMGSGFCAPCGLIKIETTAQTTFRVKVRLAAGTYHGVYAERMI